MTIYKQTIQTEMQLRVVLASILFQITNPSCLCQHRDSSLSETERNQVRVTRQINNRSQREATTKREQVPNVNLCWIPIER
jgi:hypothetical protein